MNSRKKRIAGGETMRFLTTLLFLASMSGAVAQSSECKIEDFSYQEKADSLYISGATVCREGRLTVRFYDGETDEFLASDYTFIKGYSFQMYVDARVPRQLNIKYAIDPR